jgi:hypothetical protein
MRTFRITVSLVLGMAILATAASAFADPPRGDDDVVHRFDDAELSLVRPGRGCGCPRPRRSVPLVRPRLHFVHRLIEAVEKM